MDAMHIERALTSKNTTSYQVSSVDSQWLQTYLRDSEQSVTCKENKLCLSFLLSLVYK